MFELAERSGGRPMTRRTWYTYFPKGGKRRRKEREGGKKKNSHFKLRSNFDSKVRIHYFLRYCGMLDNR